MRIALMGSPGVGKGTQARMLAERHGDRHISTGDLIRQAMKAGTPEGLAAKDYMSDGRLVPDAIVRKVAEEALSQQHFDHFVLDGYPRTVQQAVWLKELLHIHDNPLQVVISFNLPEEVIIDRLSKRRVHRVTGENYHLDHKPPPPDLDPALIMQRPDDAPEAIRRRLQIYHAETEPVKAYYQQEGLLVEMDAEGDFWDVYRKIEEIVEKVEQEVVNVSPRIA